MNRMKSSLLFSLLFVSFHNVQGTGFGLNVDIVPNSISETTQSAVTISCVPGANMDSAVDELMLLELKKDDKMIVKVRYSSEIDYGKGMAKKIHAEGQIAKVTSQSYLNTTLLFPKQEDAGEYECKMYYLDDKGGLNTKFARGNLSFINTKDRPAFTAKCTQVADFRTGDTIIFNEVLFKEGQGYDEKTGVFTAPIDGVYNFELTAAMAKPNGYINMNLLVDNAVQAGITVADKDYDDQSSIGLLVKLVKGSVVKAVIESKTDDSMFLNTRHGWTVLSGYLIK